MKTWIIALGLLTLSQSAFAQSHVFWCGILGTAPQRQVLVEVDEKDVASGFATVTLSQMPSSEESNAAWTPIVSGPMKTQLSWGKKRGVRVITGVEISMGRSGTIKAKITKRYNRDFSAPGLVSSNALEMYFPEGVEADYCQYFLKGGPRPALTGSN